MISQALNIGEEAEEETKEAPLKPAKEAKAKKQKKRKNEPKEESKVSHVHVVEKEPLFKESSSLQAALEEQKPPRLQAAALASSVEVVDDAESGVAGHNPKGKFKCQSCALSFMSKKLYEKHRKTAYHKE